MFRYKDSHFSLDKVAHSLLADVYGEGARVHVAKVDAVKKRLIEHMTGERPIDGEAWLKKELKDERRTSR